MGRIETHVKKRARRHDIRRLVLTTVGVAGLVGMAIVAPNAIQAIHKLGLIPVRRQKDIINRARDRMLKRGLLKRVDDRLCLSKKGELLWRLYEEGGKSIQKPKRWDGKWRVLVFDLPERRKAARDKVRSTLVALGFERLQDSVWVSPYDHEDLVALLKADFKIGRDLLYMVVEEMEGDRALRLRFNLPL